ncbi:hypothetical protein J6590_061734 [Homalodisca vitripennis]|nr:hypothetical protein J6590_061734 [Homalodisca vitripennis]
MERLPLEVLELVAENLTTKDLSACSAVSMSWRDIFNHDSLWKPHCNISIADYLETAECQVQPGFVSPVMENNKLSPICHWRMCFMRENHLFKNWRGMRYVVNKVKASHDSFFHSTFLSDDYLIEITDGRASLWDMRKTPVHLSDPFDFPCIQRTAWSGRIGDNMFCVAQCLCVLLYHFNTIFDEKWNLLRFFFIGGEESLSPSDSALLRCDRPGPSIDKMLVIGNIFLGCSNDVGAKGVLHVWDIKEGKRLNRIDFTMKYGSDIKIDRLIRSETLSLDFVIILETKILEKHYRYSIQVHSIKEVDFPKFSVNHDLPYDVPDYNLNCIINGRFLAVTFCGFVYVYNYLTSQLVVTSTPTQRIQISSSSTGFAISNMILFLENNMFTVAFNTDTLQITPLKMKNAYKIPRSTITANSLTSNYFISEYGSSCALWELGRDSSLGGLLLLLGLADVTQFWAHGDLPIYIGNTPWQPAALGGWRDSSPLPFPSPPLQHWRSADNYTTLQSTVTTLHCQLEVDVSVVHTAARLRRPSSFFPYKKSFQISFSPGPLGWQLRRLRSQITDYSVLTLSGAEYKKRAKKKLEEQERVLKQTKRLDLFFKTPGEQEIAPVLEGPALDDSIF